MSDIYESDDDVLGEFEAMDGDLLQETQDFKVPPDAVATMVRYFGWNEKKTEDKFWESAQPCNFFALAKLVPPEIMLPEPVFKECAICCDEAYLIGFSCFDLFCESCWKGHIRAKISEGVLSIPCLEPECDLMPSDGFIWSMIDGDEKSMDVYHELIINSYIANENHVKWCPAPDCQLVTKVETINCQSIRCKCGHNFCFKCCKECHEPVNCSLVEEWIKEYELALDEKEFSLWSGENSKECPKCKSSIEKNGGCNHMTCRKPGCTNEFCWLCLKNWSHGHICNQYERKKWPLTVLPKLKISERIIIVTSTSTKDTRIINLQFYDGLKKDTYEYLHFCILFERVGDRNRNLSAMLNREDPKAFEIEQQCGLVNSLRNNLLSIATKELKMMSGFFLRRVQRLFWVLCDQGELEFDNFCLLSLLLCLLFLYSTPF
uniref:RBR-type E3 ubiquitin transferase n=1 Tax=Ditylenchus dipsaci TaxID=166011 RepID=A0A915CL38_9BILA